ncbi:PiggyBac transposable element-derived protein, partial [Trinorchestia longiramus]
GSVILNFLDTLELAYPQRKLSLYFDNFLTSLKLLDEICNRGHGATGTVRSNWLENCPVSDSKKFGKQARGTEKHFVDKSSGTIVVQWNDNAVVCITSNQQGILPM